LVLARIAILCSESHGTHDHTSLSHGFRIREVSDSVLLKKLAVAKIVKTLPLIKLKDH
jgi:hypothetical protein